MQGTINRNLPLFKQYCRTGDSVPWFVMGSLTPHCLLLVFLIKLLYYPISNRGDITMNEYEILLIWDDEARVWVAQNNDIPLALENGSLDLLMEQVRLAVPEILELNGKEHDDVYLDFTTKRRAKVIA